LRVRQAQISDIPVMLGLARESPVSPHWTQCHYEDLFAAETRNQPERFAWVIEARLVEDGCDPKSAASNAVRVLGFLVAHKIDAEWELENIVVAAAERRKGLGSQLVNDFVAHVRAVSGVYIFLEARESNHNARALYEKFEFEKVGVRKNYYAQPPEDAVLYRLNLR
jgi:ribosomal-protein-alanine N-acetyltransferase